MESAITRLTCGRHRLGRHRSDPQRPGVVPPRL
ncbi:hypothetical protein BIW11_12492 [Tropilaelaps mercedesae]|uniref:Uncharacterized protein n=1 Tax=Tropilaelaps mercedesae TaxID=418985 RepID=A0A1V9X660_9ACAR|nr:hypothetical protein BIW11_12492 [Tropilaelaps mercedesae]